MKFLVFLAGLFSSLCFGAPDEALLGKAEGYPYCAPTASTGAVPERCLVALYSRYDADIPAHKVARAPVAGLLVRSPAEPRIEYKHQDQPRSIDAFLDSNRNTGLLVLSDNRILVERYQYGRKAEDRFQAMSMTKTVVAMLVGIAVAEGKIASIDDLAAKYVPELKGHPYGETSLRHLLTMSSGVRFVESFDGKDDGHQLVTRTLMQQGPGGADTVAPFRDNPREHPAGSHFSYASGDSQVLGLVLRAAVGRPLAEYLSEKIWQPMGAEADATWLVDRGGYETGYMGINATLRDWGRFGLLLANDGALRGRQIIPAEWVRAATSAESPHLRVGTAARYNGYGYQTWLITPSRRMFAALGLRGQAIFVDPVSKLVVVHTAVYTYDRDARAEQFSLFFGTIQFLKSSS